MSPICSHLERITVTELPDEIDGCCDSSPHQHASAHEPGEDWSWCYIDNAMFVVSTR